MSSGNDSDANAVLSEDDTQFVAQSGDEDVLWAVQEITAERGHKYRVKWVGTNPATGKPWAQSWVAKHDCTTDLVVAWKKKKRKKALGVGGRGTSTASRTSGASKNAGSSTSGTGTRTGTGTRRSASKGTSSRRDSAGRDVSPPPPTRAPAKRKRAPETPATSTAATTTAGTSRGAVMRAEEQAEEESRPRKKQKTLVEVLLPPISSDEEDPLSVPARLAVTMQNKVPATRTRVSVDIPGKRGRSLDEGKGKAQDHSHARAKGTASASDVREEASMPRAKTKTKEGPRREAHVADADVASSESEDEDLRPPRSKPKPKSKPVSTRISSLERRDGVPEKEMEPTTQPLKIGPPRGVKRRKKDKSRDARLLSKPRPLGDKRQTETSADEREAPAEEPVDHVASVFGSPLRKKVNDRTSPSLHISIPQVSPDARPRSPILSPGAKARLELFDRMMEDPSPDTDLPLDMPDDTYFDVNHIHDDHDALDAFEPPPPTSPPPAQSKSKHSKPDTPNGLIVPETESSGISQSQSQSLLKPPSPLPQPLPARDPSPRKSADLPTIAVIAASAPPSSASPQDVPQKLPPATSRPKKPTFKMSIGGLGSTTNVRARVDDAEAPPSSIESFTSPKRVDKGKQRAVDDDQPQSDLSEREDGGRTKKTQKKTTDSELRKRGKELFDQAQLAREAAWKKSKKPKRLKAIHEIVNVNGAGLSTSKGSPLPLMTGSAEGALELRLEDVVDLTGGANSTTLDTQERSEAKPLSEEERARLRIELRQEEEENTQEAMGIYPLLPIMVPDVVNGVDPQMPPPKSPKSSPSGGPMEDVEHLEQPSTELNRASVIVQASQEGHDDTDMDPLLADPSASSPVRPVPENLTDSPRRRLGEALSVLNAKSEEIARLERELVDAHKNVQELKAEVAELKRSSEPTGPVRAAWDAERAQWTEERSKWENDLSTWETQRKEMSEEKAGLSVRVAELSDATVRAEGATTKLSELEVERADWTKERDVMRSDIAQRSEELVVLAKVREDYDQERIKWEADKVLWAEEKARWEVERTALQERQETLSRSVDELTTSVESMSTAKVSAEQDRDFFREQYAQASGFVSSVREENVELEKRVTIAEGQAQEGVAAIKALFEGRVKALQADIDRWKGLTELLQEKDRRTTDELRLRAAQVPELVELCGRLTAENRILEADVRKLGQAKQRGVFQRNKLFYEILLLKKERASLKAKLSKLAKTPNGSTQDTVHSAPTPSAPTPLTPKDPESIDPNDMESLPDPTPQSLNASFEEPALFPCMWRPRWRDQCQQIFDSKEDLERHVQDHFRDLLVQ